MNEPLRLSWPEAYAWAALVAAHWLRTARNPTDEECDQMVVTAREMTAVGATLQ